jgi:hypothetical protein
MAYVTTIQLVAKLTIAALEVEPGPVRDIIQLAADRLERNAEEIERLEDLARDLQSGELEMP